MKKSVIILLAIIFIAFEARSQAITTATIKWNTTNTQNESDGMSDIQITSMTTYGSSKIEWRESGTLAIKTLEITEAMGEWNDINQEGWMQYEVKDGLAKGTIAIRKYATETKAFISIGSEAPIRYVLTINGYDIL